MADKDLGEELDKLEGLKDKEFRLFGIKMTPMTIGAALTAVGSLIGMLYAGFTMYQKIEEVSGLDVGQFQEEMRVISQKIDAQQNNIDTQSKLLQSIEDNLRDTKQLTYDVEKRMNDKTNKFEQKMDRFSDKVEATQQAMEDKVDKVQKDLEDRIQKALDNPLAN